MKQLAILILFLMLAGSASAANFPGNEEIQTTAWSADPTGTASITATGAGLAMPDVAMSPYADQYIAGRVGVSNFQGHTYEGGSIKFCTSALPAACALRPYGAITRPGFYQRNIDVTKTLGNVVYNYSVFKPDALRPTYWAIVWQGDQAQTPATVVLSSDSANNLAGLSNAFTGGASLGPWWGVLRVQGFTLRVGSTIYSPCYMGTASQNLINAGTAGMPFTTRCQASGAGVSIWQHIFARRIAAPIVTSK